ncbi:MAG: HD domain-containing protein [Mariniblastus sp.]
MPIKRIIQAADFAAEKHRNQRRKDIYQTPYINHPIEVANLLASVGGIEDEAMIIAALLHDTIEDTDTSADEIEERFGKEVLGLVLELTDDKSLEKADRKRLQIENAPKKSSAAKQIKLADKICNVSGMCTDSPAAWSRARKIEYLDWAEKVVSGCFGVNENLDELFRSRLEQSRENVGPE